MHTKTLTILTGTIAFLALPMHAGTMISPGKEVKVERSEATGRFSETREMHNKEKHKVRDKKKRRRSLIQVLFSNSTYWTDDINRKEGEEEAESPQEAQDSSDEDRKEAA